MIKGMKKFILGGFIFGASFVPVTFFSTNGVISNTSTVNAETTVSQATNGAQVKNTEQNADKTLEGLVKILNLVLKVLYILLWPLLAIAGVSMDNGFINGEWFHMDFALWRFWNIIKVFSYYILGFIFVLSIFLHFFNGKSDKFKPSKVIPKLFLGGVGIAFSWFILKVLLDFSTILTYGLGGMPLSVIGDTTLDKHILATDSNLQLNDLGNIAQSKKDIEFSYVCGENKYASCVYVEGKFSDEFFKEQMKTLPGHSKEFCVNGNMLLSAYGHDINNPENVNISQKNMEGQGCPKISTLLEKSRGFTGPFFGLVGSLLNIGTLVMTPSNKTIASLGVEFIIKSLIGIALIIPLLVLAVVLVVRVVVIWMITAFSPLIILSEIFGFKVGGDKASLSSILGLIFLPVTAVFAVSISLVFMSLLINASPQVSDSGNIQGNNLANFGLELVSTEGDTKCYKTVLGNKICIETANTESGMSFALNNFSWLIINLLGVALMWTIVFASLKTSKITNNIVSGVEGFAKSTMKTLPIIPAPGGALSIGALQQGAQYVQNIPGMLTNKNYQSNVDPFLASIREKMSGDFEKVGEKYTPYLESSTRGEASNNLFADGMKGQVASNSSGGFADHDNAGKALHKFTSDNGMAATSDIMVALENETFRNFLIKHNIDIVSLIAGSNQKKKDDVRAKIREQHPDLFEIQSTGTDETPKLDKEIKKSGNFKIIKKGDGYVIMEGDVEKGKFEGNDEDKAKLIKQWNSSVSNEADKIKDAKTLEDLSN
ncbi:MAG: hypothetical protein V3575_06820 [Candidatus Absconditabacteria bacterium]